MTKGTNMGSIGIGLPIISPGYRMTIPPIAAFYEVGIVDLGRPGSVAVGAHVGFWGYKIKTGFDQVNYKYFNTLFGQGFNRQFDSPVNAALNYGYSILLSTFNNEIVSRGYLTQLGIFHDNQFNQFNLSSDLMEPFRAFVDRKVLTLSITEFTLEIKHELVDLLNQPVMIDSSRQLLSNAINIYCSSVFRALLTADPSQLLHYQWSDS